MPVAQTVIDSGALASLAIFGAQVPAEGPKALPLLLDFTASDSYVLDYSNQQRQNKLSMVQTVYVDTSLSDVPVVVTCAGLNQPIIAKGRTQGYYPVCAPNPFKATISCPTGPAGVVVIFLNYPVTASQWPTQ